MTARFRPSLSWTGLGHYSMQAGSLDSQSLGWGGRPLLQHQQQRFGGRGEEGARGVLCPPRFAGTQVPLPARSTARPAPSRQQPGRQQQGGPNRQGRVPTGEARIKHQGYRRLWQQVTQVGTCGLAQPRPALQAQHPACRLLSSSPCTTGVKRAAHRCQLHKTGPTHEPRPGRAAPTPRPPCRSAAGSGWGSPVAAAVPSPT